MKRHQPKRKPPTPASPGHYEAVTEKDGEFLIDGQYPSRAAARRAVIEAAAGRAYRWHRVPSQ